MKKVGFFDWLSEQKDKVITNIKQHANKDFMEAIAAGCALIACADGTIDEAEKQKVTGFISMNDALKVFKLEDILERFNYYANMLEFDFNVGKFEAIKIINKIKKNGVASKTCIAVCCSIALADGKFDASERRIVNEICFGLDLNPAELQLEY